MVDASPASLSLARLPVGVPAVVTVVDSGVSESLDDVGIVAGTRLTVERRIPLGGPVIVRLGIARVAVARRIAACVAVVTT